MTTPATMFLTSCRLELLAPHFVVLVAETPIKKPTAGTDHKIKHHIDITKSNYPLRSTRSVLAFCTTSIFSTAEASHLKIQVRGAMAELSLAGIFNLHPCKLCRKPPPLLALPSYRCLAAAAAASPYRAVPELHATTAAEITPLPWDGEAAEVSDVGELEG